ncbi:ATP-binding protein [Methylopila henanensis]|uniref:histidine kinase n=1 Tax=Methylopila henanensis TaxID=873516 RepID=A0ABW4K519_9HYPH
MTDADPTRPDRASSRAAMRLRRAGWTLVAVAAALAAFVAARRLGPVEALLAFAFVALATIVAPARRTPAEASRSRANPADAIVGPQTLLLLQGLPGPTLVLDPRGVVLAFNAHAGAALPTIRVGDPVSFALRVPEVLAAVKEAASLARPALVSYSERVPVERWIEAHVAPAAIGPQGPRAIVLALRDLTAQRRAERTRVDFVANASHELRTPLASLLGFIETLQGPARNDEKARERFLEIMRSQATRMSRLIDDLLSLSRIELKAHVRPDALVELAPIARNVADALGPLAADRGVEIAVALPETPVWVRGDRDELIRVVENLVENGVKYGRSGGRVDVAVEGGEGPQAARLVVRDYGPGIPPEDLPRLTERFYRGDVQASREAGGTGLGLALAKHILTRHAGQLLIESRLGEGARFTVTLDGAAPPKPAPEGARLAG